MDEFSLSISIANVHYNSRRACAIADDDEVIISGGLATGEAQPIKETVDRQTYEWAGLSSVARYNMDGYVEDGIPQLTYDIWGHSCGKYTNSDGDMVTMELWILCIFALKKFMFHVLLSLLVKVKLVMF